MQISPELRDYAAAVYSIPIPVSGRYEVFISYTAYGDRASSRSPHVEITHANGHDSVNVDMRKGGGRWHALGTYSFDEGSSEQVTLVAGRGGISVADAVRFRPVSFVPTLSARFNEGGSPEILFRYWTRNEATYRLQRSTNLLGWTPLGEPIEGNGLWQDDPLPGGSEPALYRIIETK